MVTLVVVVRRPRCLGCVGTGTILVAGSGGGHGWSTWAGGAAGGGDLGHFG